MSKRFLRVIDNCTTCIHFSAGGCHPCDPFCMKDNSIKFFWWELEQWESPRHSPPIKYSYYGPEYEVIVAKYSSLGTKDVWRSIFKIKGGDFSKVCCGDSPVNAINKLERKLTELFGHLFTICV